MFLFGACYTMDSPKWVEILKKWKKVIMQKNGEIHLKMCIFFGNKDGETISEASIELFN